MKATLYTLMILSTAFGILFLPADLQNVLGYFIVIAFNLFVFMSVDVEAIQAKQSKKD